MVRKNTWVILFILLGQNLCGFSSVETKETIPRQYRQYILDSAVRNDIPPELLAAIIKVESNWDHRALGYNVDSTDYGLGQINSKYEYWYVKKFGMVGYDRDNPKDQIELAARILVWSGAGFDHYYQWLMAYNCGRSRVVNNKIPQVVKDYAEKVFGYYVMYKE